MPSQSHPGARSEMKIENLSSSPVMSDQIRIDFNHPEGVDITVGRAIETPRGWKPRYDIGANEALILPVFVRLEPWVEHPEGAISISLQIDGDETTTSIELLS
jgi:hypothetical protein